MSGVGVGGGPGGGGAQILDRGYRRFDGERSGVSGAMRSVVWHTIRGMLGLGRKFRFKIVPILIIIVGFLPAVGFAAAFIIIRIVAGIEEFADAIQPEYWELFANSYQSIVLFAALMAPDAIVRDRRDGMVSLYLTTPLTRPTYLVSKFIAVVGVLAIIVIVPTALYLIAITFAGLGPNGFGEWAVDFIGILAAGLLACIVYGAISMAASSLSDRRSFATAIVIVVFFGTLTTVSIMTGLGNATETWHVLNAAFMPLEMIARVFGDEGNYPEVATSSVYLANAGWTVAAGLTLWWRYRDAGV